MPNQYTINVINQNVDSKFAIFQAPPTVAIAPGTGSGGGSGGGLDPKDVFSNVWVAADINPGGQLSVTATADFYSWAGDAPEKAAVGVTTLSGKALPVTLGTKPTMVHVSVEEGIVVSNVVKDNAPSGIFEIVTQPLTTESAIIIGVAKPDPNNLQTFLPTAVINATGNMKYTIKTVNNFYIAKFAGKVNVGQIFDFKAISDQKGLISFSDNPGAETANVIFDDESTFQISYTRGQT